MEAKESLLRMLLMHLENPKVQCFQIIATLGFGGSILRHDTLVSGIEGQSVHGSDFFRIGFANSFADLISSFNSTLPDFSNFSSDLILAVVFEVDGMRMIGGSVHGGRRVVFCSTDLAKLGVCKQGQIIYHPFTNDPSWLQVIGASFDMDSTKTTLQPRSIQITKIGTYNLYFIHCDTQLQEVYVEGNNVWKNLTGYLPGRLAPLKKIYGLMSLAFVLLGLFRFSQHARFWREVLSLQNGIALGMFEMALWYFDYAAFNKTGTRSGLPNDHTNVWVNDGALMISHFSDLSVQQAAFKGAPLWPTHPLPKLRGGHLEDKVDLQVWGMIHPSASSVQWVMISSSPLLQSKLRPQLSPRWSDPSPRSTTQN